jgi:hypothetical protein
LGTGDEDRRAGAEVDRLRGDTPHLRGIRHLVERSAINMDVRNNGHERLQAVPDPRSRRLLFLPMLIRRSSDLPALFEQLRARIAGEDPAANKSSAASPTAINQDTNPRGNA